MSDKEIIREMLVQAGVEFNENMPADDCRIVIGDVEILFSANHSLRDIRSFPYDFE